MQAVIINKETGEILQEGVFKNYETIKKQKEFLERKEEKEFIINEKYKEYGNFIWILYNISTDYDLSISPSDLTRLMFISTYLTYDNSLKFDNKKDINKNNINTLLKLSDREYKYFYQNMIKNNIFIEKESKIYINTEYFYKGNIDEVDFKDKNITRLYIEGIRDIYNKSLPRSHKQLSYVFKILPFVNINYNMICKNPTETNLDKIIPMSVEDFCDIIKYDSKRALRLIRKFNDCYFVKDEYILSIVFRGEIKKSQMFINPHIYYAGNYWDKVEVLGSFCKKE